MANLAVVTPGQPATPASEPAAAAEGAKPKSPRSKLLLPIVAATAVIGIGLGALVIAPMSGGGAGISAADKHAIGGGAAEKGAPSIIEIENIVVNPAGAEGLHFIMCSVALEMHDKKSETWIRANQHIVRDVIIGTLGKQNLDSLGRPGVRNQIKAQIAREVGNLIGGADKLAVYLPEFVVQ